MAKDLFVQGEELRKHPGHAVVSDLLTLRISRYTFEGNYIELVRFLDRMTVEEAGLELLPMMNRDKLEAAFRELIRRLHNFVAATMSLWLHMTTLREHWYQEADERREAVEQHATEAFRDPESRFVQKLRVYCQHYALPSTSLHVRVTAEGEELREVKLPTPQLLKWDGWNAEARGYLQQVGDAVPLREVCERYYRRVDSLFDWFFSDVQDLHRDTIEDFFKRGQDYGLRRLEREVDLALNIRERGEPRTRDQAFAQFLDSTEFAGLEGTAPVSAERGERVIEALEQRGLMSDTIREKIRTLYQLPFPSPGRNVAT